MKICFLSLGSYPILTNKNLGYVGGGAELQQVLLGRELVTRGYDVCFVTYRHGQNQIESVNRIKIIKTYEREKAHQLSVPLKYMSIWSSLKKADADIYFHSSGAPGVLPLFCHLNRKTYILRIPSDAVVLSKSISGSYDFFGKIANMLEIKSADIIVAQSNFQKRILKERFGVESVLIKNGLPLPYVNPEKPDPPVVLWVGSISYPKRPDLFIKLAKSIPNARFEMVGDKTRDWQLYEKIKIEEKMSPNFRFHGFVPYHEVDEYFRRASIFVSTSSIEGFPNTFLQAWANYTPVVSLNVDPDGIIRRYKLGFYSKTFAHLVSDVTKLLECKELRKKMGENGRRYVEKEHDIKKTVEQYIGLFKSLQGA
jgi:glycosyltransferase involved in cell wall biosynthesis